MQVFVKNKYRSIYLRMINHRRLNPHQEGVYTESHHILPKSIFPQFAKEKWNLVSLSGREHYIAHLLLSKMCVGDDMIKMQSALWMMSNLKRLDNKVTSRLFEVARSNHAQNVSVSRTGIKRREDTIQKIVDGSSKEWILYNKDGERFEISNLKRFCAQENLSYPSLHLVVSGKTRVSQGYSLTPDASSRRSSYNIYEFFDQNNTKIATHDLSEFCKVNDLKYQKMIGVMNGKIRSYEGYRLKCETPVDYQKSKSYTLYKDGEEISVFNLKAFADENGLSYTNLWKVVKGTRKQHRGYTTKLTQNLI